MTHDLGLGCWAIGGPFFEGDAPKGWGEIDDATSKRAIAAGVAAGITLFDTAQAYGTGHSEEVLGEALAAHPRVAIVTKIGIGINPATRQLTGPVADPAAIADTLSASRKRLRRDSIDTVVLHLNGLPIAEAELIFDALEEECDAGRLGNYGWSTDYPDRAAAFADRERFTTVEHAMNILLPATAMRDTLRDLRLRSLIRSPLAMGILAAKYDVDTEIDERDIRFADQNWMAYFVDGKPSPRFIAMRDAIHDILTSEGRSLVQGALAWLWAHQPGCLPIPGFRTAAQVEELCAARDHGPLSDAQMAEIEDILDRPPEGPPGPR